MSFEVMNPQGLGFVTLVDGAYMPGVLATRVTLGVMWDIQTSLLTHTQGENDTQHPRFASEHTLPSPYLCSMKGAGHWCGVGCSAVGPTVLSLVYLGTCSGFKWCDSVGRADCCSQKISSPARLKDFQPRKPLVTKRCS